MTQEHGELLRSFTKIASKCTTISTEIDETDCEIRTQLSDYINRFTGVEHAKILSFLTSSVDLNEFELAFQMIENYFNTTNGSVSTTILDIDDVRFTRDRNVVAVYKRVLAGRQLLLEYKTQLTELNAIHNYLEQFNFNDDVLLNNIQNGWKLLEHELDIKRKKKHHDLEIISQNFDCSSLSAVKLICADKLLTDYQVTFNHLNAIADQLINTRSYLIVIHRLYSIKSNDIRRCDQILKMLTIFLTENLETNHRRIEKMTKIINHYNTQTFDDKFKFIDNCAILLSNESSSLNEVLEQLLKLQTNIDDMEKLLFFTKINEASTNAKDFLNNINVLEKYLLNGSPTRQAIIISPNLLAALNETEMNFEQTTSQLKWAMQLSADALKKISHDKWFRYGRQLWMYFLHNPTKMTFIIEQIKTELERKQQQKQCFVVNQK